VVISKLENLANAGGGLKGRSNFSPSEITKLLFREQNHVFEISGRLLNKASVIYRQRQISSEQLTSGPLLNHQYVFEIPRCPSASLGRALMKSLLMAHPHRRLVFRGCDLTDCAKDFAGHPKILGPTFFLNDKPRTLVVKQCLREIQLLMRRVFWGCRLTPPEESLASPRMGRLQKPGVPSVQALPPQQI